MLKKIRPENNILAVIKPIGLTPLDVIKALKLESTEFAKEKIGYAGRLDPMAEGLLLLLIGNENKNKKKYENLSKSYDIEILFGFKTDTYDILGRILESKEDLVVDFTKGEEALKSYIGRFSQEYPPYSSKTVNGKPLYYYARRNLLNSIKIPKREVEIYEISDVKKDFIDGKRLHSSICERINLVNGDFRQEEILKDWQEKINTKNQYPVISLTVKCSSGTYMRSLANNLGEKLNLPAIAFSITRTEIGDFKIS